MQRSSGGEGPSCVCLWKGVDSRGWEKQPLGATCGSPGQRGSGLDQLCSGKAGRAVNPERELLS